MRRFLDHDPEFLRRLRQGVRERAQRRRVALRRVPWNRRRVFPSGLIWSAVVIAGAAAALFQSGEPSARLQRSGAEAAFALACLLLVSDFERRIVALLNHWPDLLAAVCLPTTNIWMGYRQMARSRPMLPPLLLISLAVALLVALFHGMTGLGALAALAYAVTMTAVVVVLAVWLAGTGAGGWLSAGLWGGLVCVWISSKVFPGFRDTVLAWLNETGGWLVLVVPTGWVVRPFYGLVAGGRLEDWLGLLPVGVLLASLPTAMRRLISVHRLRDRALLMYASQVPDDASDPFREAFNAALVRPETRAADQLRQMVLSGAFLETPPTPASGWVERWVKSRWTPRERRLAQWALPVLPGWSRRYAICTAVAASSLATSALGGALELSWILAVAVVVLGLTPVSPVLGRFGAAWRVGQGSVVALGMFPLSFLEVARWALKTSRLRLLLGAPQALAVGAAIGWLQPESLTPQQGFFCAGVVLFAVAGLQPFWLLESLMGASWRQTTGPFRWIRRLSVYGLFLLWVLFNLAALALTVFSGPVAGLATAAVGMWTGHAALAWVARQWASGRLELLVLPEAGEGG